jgi:hypothetical protein
MVFNVTFNSIAVISWQSVLLVEETGVPRENPDLLESDKFHHKKLYRIPLHEQDSTYL